MFDRFLRRPPARAEQVAAKRAAEHAADRGRIDVMGAAPDHNTLHWVLRAAVWVTVAATLAQVVVAVGTARPADRLSAATLNGMPLTAAAAAALGIRLGRPKWGAQAFVGMLWLEMAIHIAFEGGTNSPSFGSYALVVLAAGLVLGVRLALIYGLLTISVGVALLFAELGGALPAFSPTPAHRLAAHVARVVAAMGILWVSMRAVVQALMSARASQRSERRLRGRLAALHALSLDLSREGDVDQLLRKAVEAASKRLGLGRAGLWLSTDGRSARGTWGTDERGQVRAEHKRRLLVEPGSMMGLVLAGEEDLLVEEDRPLRDDRGNVIGIGWQAIAALRGEHGVQGCLSVDGLLMDGPPPSHLRAILRDYASTLDHLVRRLEAEQTLRRREQVLAAVGDAARLFLDASEWTDAIDDVLARLGEAGGVGRVYLVELVARRDALPEARLRNAWRAAGVASLPAGPLGGVIDLVASRRWNARIDRGDPFMVSLSSLPVDERALLAAQGTRSLALVPIGIAGASWGCLVYDDVTDERRWAPTELDALRAAAALVGAAIERTRGEKALRQAQRLESVGVLAGGVAHDFNNLLTGVLGQSTIAMALLDEEAQARVHVEKSIQSAELAASLVRQLLAYAGRGEQQLKPIDLNTVVREAAMLLEAALPAGLLELSLAADLPPLMADRTQVQQVIMNLVLNAHEAMPEGHGAIEIRTELGHVDGKGLGPGWVGGSPPAPAAMLCLSVLDEGPGIRPRERERIFEPFYSEKGQGRGLGLPAVLGILRRHKGAIHVSERPNGGTVFRIFLPLLDLSAKGVEARVAMLSSTDPGDRFVPPEA